MSRTRIVIISFFVLACCLGSSNEVRSEEIGPAGEEIPTVEKKPVVLIDDVVVTVNRADRQEFELPRSVEVISSDSVRKKNPKSLPDLLDETTGVYVQKTNPGAGSPIIRGFVGPENLILIDGVRFNNSTFRTGPNQYLAMIDPWSVERLEVLRGPGSVMYGTDAMGGVINAVTLSPRKLDDRLFGVTGRLDFASAYLHAGGSAQADLATGPVSGYVGGTFNHYGEIRAGGGESEPASDYQRGSARFKSTQKISDNWTLTEAMFWTTIQGAGRSDNLSIGELRYYDNQDVLAYVRAERKGSGSGARVKLNLSYHFTDEWVRRYNCATDGTGAVEDRAACITHNLSTLEKMRNNRDRVHTPGFFTTWEGHFWHQRLRMVLGADGYFDMISSSRRDSKRDDVWAWQDKDRGNFSEGSQYLTLGGFLMGDVDVLRLGPSTIAINGGIRLSYFEAFAPDVPVLGNVRYQHVGAVGSAGLAYLFKDLLNVYADFSQGFRAPNLQESTVLGNTGTFFEVPADSLVPQTSDTVEVGVKLKTRYLRVTVAGFASWLDDAFAREEVPMSDWDEYGISSNDVGDQAVMKRVNAASAFYRGVESSLAVGPFAGVSLWGNGAVVIGDVTDQKGNEAPGRRVPPVSGAAGVRWELQRIRLFAEFFVKWALAQDRLSSGDRQDLRICEDKSSPGQFLDNCAGTSGWVTLNLRAGYVPLDWLQLNLSIENLADTRYKYHGSGIYSPGINALAGLTLTY